MSKLLMLKGLPGSGKSTYAKELTARGNWKRVNKDDLRTMLDNGKWSKGNEQFVLKARDMLVRGALAGGQNSVVVDDTNFAPSHEISMQQIADEFKIPFEVKFFDTPLEECIKRDLGRAISVGEHAIRQMYDKFLKLPADVYTPPKNKPRAILCDIDGTIAHMFERSPYDWHKVGTDNPDKMVIEILRRFDNKTILLMSGRDSVCRPETVEWLHKNKVPFHYLYMRDEEDTRKDSVIKRELFEKNIRDNFQVEFVLDDRNQVVDMWRSLGLKCLQVADGNF